MRSDRLALPALIALLLAMSAIHVYYLTSSAMTPVADEAHYLGGSFELANGLRAGIGPAWRAWLSLLGYKAPLICVPGALVLLITGEPLRSPMLALVPIFFALGLAGYSLFRNLFAPTGAAIAAALLVSSPLITGLTHRFYVESLMLLIAVVYLDLLLRHGFSSWRWSVVIGAVLGCGVLCKSTFAPMLGLASLFVFGQAVRGETLKVIGRAALILAVAFALAFPWYRHNWVGLTAHVRAAATCTECAYPGLDAFLANISSGPYVFVFVMALVGLVGLIHNARRLPPAEVRAWVALGLVAVTTLLVAMLTINKATRFTVTWLPMIAALAAAARPGKVALGAVGLSLLLFLNNCFGIFPRVALGDLRIVSASFPLNIPDWHDDNHPIDRRELGLDEAERAISADAAQHFPGRQVSAHLTVQGLILNHDYFNLLAHTRGHPVMYLWFHGTVLEGTAGPDYVLHAKGFREIIPGRYFFEHRANLEDEVRAGKVPYALVSRITRPAGTELQIYRRVVNDLPAPE